MKNFPWNDVKMVSKQSHATKYLCTSDRGNKYDYFDMPIDPVWQLFIDTGSILIFSYIWVISHYQAIIGDPIGVNFA